MRIDASRGGWWRSKTFPNNMSTISKKTPIQPQQFITSLFEMAYSTSDERDAKNPAKIRADLKAAGLDPDKAVKDLQARLKAFDSRKRLEAARASRLAESKTEVVRPASTSESRESLIEQIRKFLTLDGAAAVYANKWEKSSVEDLASLRNQLAETASRNVRRNASA